MREDGGGRDHGTFFVESRSLGLDVLRYGLAMLVVAAVATAVVLRLSQVASSDEASELNSAVLIDLPSAQASAAPVRDAAEGPEQTAAQASVARQAPAESTEERPVVEAKPAPELAAAPVETPPPSVAPNPPAVLERRQEAVPTPPKPVVAPALRAQEELAPSGAAAPAKTDATDGDEGRPHASKHAITLWQRSLLQRLERAKRFADRQPGATGTVRVAFAIDATGALVSIQVTQTSGSASLDRAALLIVRQAAPFPAPPPGSGARETSFVLPIRFR